MTNILLNPCLIDIFAFSAVINYSDDRLTSFPPKLSRLKNILLLTKSNFKSFLTCSPYNVNCNALTLTEMF